jgi:hypothetical protein
MLKYISQPKMKTKKIIPAIVFLSLFELFSIDIKPAHANPQQCYNDALPTFADSDTADLVASMCQGSTSTVTAKCFKTALPTFYTPLAAKRAAMLCKGVTSIAPGECFRDSIGTFFTDESVERGYKLCKVNSLPENHHNSHREERSGDGIRGVWHVNIDDNWIGLLRMRGDDGNLVLVDRKNGGVVDQKIKVERDYANGYILTGSINYTTRGKYPSDKFYIQQFSTESMKVKDCDSSGKCYDVTFTYWGK